MLAPQCISGLTKNEKLQLPASAVRFEVQNDLVSIETLHKFFNDALPETIRFKEIKLVSNKFDAMANLWKQYRYTLPSEPIQLTNFCEFLASCDHMTEIKQDRKVVDTHFNIEAMKEAAQHFVGTHDFGAFQSKGGRKSTVRTVFDCRIESKKQRGNDVISIVVIGDGFLYNMVRIMTGTLCLVGREIIKAEHIPMIMASRDRRHAGPTAWANGLCLEHVEYEIPWKGSRNNS
mmetsp:Transcript_13335/g.15440  ORF Transcript_13335/g.15440 Transcript_13335/m.15440 type:complete len:233 (+) Transcript_13335:445-1143(+)